VARGGTALLPGDARTRVLLTLDELLYKLKIIDKGIYSELSKYAHPHALSLLASSRVIEGRIVQWSSVLRFKSDHDAVMAYVWVVELAEATAHLLGEFATQFELLGTARALSYGFLVSGHLE
jgi:hypothetical protein